MRLFLFVCLCLLLTACAKSPDSRSELATQGLFSASFSPDGTSALIASQLHGASYWSLSPLDRKYNWNHSGDGYTQVSATAISQDGSRAITSTKNQWIVWDTTSGKSLAFWQTPFDILSVALNKDGSRALLGLESGDIWYINSATGNNELEFKHEEAVRSVALSESTRLVLSGSDDYSAKFWSLDSGELVNTVTLKNMSRHVSFSKSGNIAFVSSLRNEHLLINTSDFSIKSSVQERYTVFNGAAFSPDESSVYLANQQGYIQAFDVQNGSEIERYKAERKSTFGTPRSVLSLWVDENALLALSSDGQLQTFSIE